MSIVFCAILNFFSKNLETAFPPVTSVLFSKPEICSGQHGISNETDEERHFCEDSEAAAGYCEVDSSNSCHCLFALCIDRPHQ